MKDTKTNPARLERNKPARLERNKPAWSLPYDTPVPAGTTPAHRTKLKIARIAAYIALAAALLVPVVQLEFKTLKNQHKNRQYKQKLAAGALTDKERLKGPPKAHKGAVNRWRSAVLGLWSGENIYETPQQFVERYRREGRQIDTDNIAVLHPNMPFTVMLLTPFALLPVSLGGLVFSLLKVIVAVLAGLAAVRVANHKNLRMPDWLVGLAVIWWVQLAIGDIQHANTNVFVLGAIVLHLWLYRRGRDLAAGGALALAICIKMTPALFVLYWLYQRNWKLLAGCLAAGVFFAVIIPAVALGPGHYIDLTQTWTDNLIFKGLGGAWYPIHVNQSIPAVLSRYLMDNQPGGNIYWNPDDNPYKLQTKFRWIALASLDPIIVKRIIQASQAAVVLLMAWAIGLRKLPRDDGRRGLHYAMILTAILLLNQRSWDHHAAIFLPATLAVWYAIAFGRPGRGVRIAALATMIAAGLLLWCGAGDMLVGIGWLSGLTGADAKNFGDVAQAYGPKFYSFLLLFITSAMLALAMKRPDKNIENIKKTDEPYAAERQKIGE